MYVWCGSIISFAESEREKRFDRQSAGYESCWHLKSQVGLTKVLLVSFNGISSLVATS